jgi:hypothetical protein
VWQKYLPILRDCVWISSDIRQAMARNVTEMLELHGRLLADIARVLPCTTQTIQGHRTNYNLIDMTKFPILSDPAAAAEVAKIFDTTVRLCQTIDFRCSPINSDADYGVFCL